MLQNNLHRRRRLQVDLRRQAQVQQSTGQSSSISHHCLILRQWNRKSRRSETGVGNFVNFFPAIDPNYDEELKKLFDDPAKGFDMSTASSGNEVEELKAVWAISFTGPWESSGSGEKRWSCRWI